MSRLGHLVRSGRPNTPRYYSPTSFFNRPLGPSDTLAADQAPALALCNQINYGHTSYSANPASGYTGTGYGNQGAYWPYSVSFSPLYYSTHPVYCVRPSDPKQNITLQKVGGYNWTSSGPQIWGAGYANNLQSHLLNVPIPDKSLCPLITGVGKQVDIWSGDENDDASCYIINLDTGEGFGFWKMDNAGQHYGAMAAAVTGTYWVCQYAEYVPNVFTSNGILPNNWGSRACSLGEIGGLITAQDIVNAYHGEPICHAIAFASGYNDQLYVPPATRGDGLYPNGNPVAKIPAGYPNAGLPNPAYGKDKVCEGQRFRFAPGTDLSYLLPKWPLGYALGCAIRDYGMIDVDTTEGTLFYLEDWRTVGSPYNLYGAHATSPYDLTWPTTRFNWDSADPSGWSVLNHLPWGQLQVLDPISN